MKKRIITILLVLVLTVVSTGIPSVFAEETEYNLNERYVRFLGRNDVNETYGIAIFWPGAGFAFKFTGTSADVYVNHMTSSVYFNVIIDGGAPTRIALAAGWNNIAADLTESEHTVTFIRSSEGNNGRAYFGKIRVNGTTPVPTETAKRRMEFYGDSYTAGYGNLETDPEASKTAANTDNYYSYANVASRALGAESNIIAHSGKGIAINNDGSTTNTLPQLSVYGDVPTGTDHYEPWDYSKFTPQVVVVFLGINDHYGKGKSDVTDPTTYITAAYKDFITSLRNNYPKANILLCSRNSNCSQTSVQAVYDELSQTDSRLHRLYFDPCPATGINSHPTVAEHEVIAAQLVEKINSIEHVWQDEESLSAVSHKTTVVVKGKVPYDYGNKPVTLIMKKKEWDVTSFSAWNENVGYAQQADIDDEGNYLFQFTFDGDISGYELLLNQGGKVVTGTVISAVSTQQLVTTTMELTQAGNRVDVVGEIVNNYGMSGINYSAILAAYSKEGVLVGATITTLKELEESRDEILASLTVSSEATYVKAHLWTEELMPLCEDKDLTLTGGNNE